MPQNLCTNKNAHFNLPQSQIPVASQSQSESESDPMRYFPTIIGLPESHSYFDIVPGKSGAASEAALNYCHSYDEIKVSKFFLRTWTHWSASADGVSIRELVFERLQDLAQKYVFFPESQACKPKPQAEAQASAAPSIGGSLVRPSPSIGDRVELRRPRQLQLFGRRFEWLYLTVSVTSVAVSLFQSGLP